MKRYLKKIMPRFLIRLLYKVIWMFIKKDHGGLTAYQTSILTILSQKNDITIVVIGANDGRINDPVYSLVSEKISDRTRMILIEPQSDLLPYLRENYEFHPRCHIANCAVGPKSTLELYVIKKEFWKRAQPPYASGWPVYRAPTGVTSSRKSMVLDWARKHISGLKDPEMAVEKITVDSLSLPELLEREGTPGKIDVLQVDAEGDDDNVIYNCCLEQTQPALIYFESSGLSEDRNKALTEYLGTLGYVTCPQGNDTLAILQARHGGRAPGRSEATESRDLPRGMATDP